MSTPDLSAHANGSVLSGLDGRYVCEASASRVPLLRRIALFAFASLVSITAAAQEGKSPWEEYEKYIQSRTTVATLGSQLFGDDVNLYNGTLSFSATDVEVPGNSSLTVAIRRTHTVSNRRGSPPPDRPFADWDLDVPRISGTFAPSWPNLRCSSTGKPPQVVAGSTAYPAEEYWQGNHADMPGGGELLVADRGARQPTSGGPYKWLTTGLTYFSCLPSIKNGAGEGFLAVTSDGTKYWFDHMARYSEPTLRSPLAQTANPIALTRKRNVLYATRVEDRFGNWVTYTYTNAATAPARLTSIQSSDARTITLAYNAQGRIASVSAHGQSWTYTYAAQDGSTAGTLTQVVLPDASKWTMAFPKLIIQYASDPPFDCGSMRDVLGGGGATRITHPSGAVGEFDVAPVMHGRTNVPLFCTNLEYPINDRTNDAPIIPRDYMQLSLTRKRITGPGLAAAEWKYSYGAGRSWLAGVGPKCETTTCMEPVCVTDACAGTSVTEVAGPEQSWQRFTYGNSYRYNEGKLLRVDRGSSATSILHSEVTRYDLARSGRPFPTPIGRSLQERSDSFASAYLRPQSERVISQDGASFSSAVLASDDLARPVSVRKYSSLPGSLPKVEDTVFHDETSRWVLSQPGSVRVNGIVVSETAYGANALPHVKKAFGQTVQTLTYHPDGSLATVADGNQNVTRLGDWYRGIPRLIAHPATPESPAGATETAAVNSSGWITSSTDENGFLTSYNYDAMGRITAVNFPTGDSVAFNSLKRYFRPLTASDSLAPGVAVGQWHSVEWKGNDRKVTYYDALWQPVLEHIYDGADTAGTMSASRFRYDGQGRLDFRSYPSRNISPPLEGTWTSYDPIGRVVGVSQDSEHGLLTSTTEHLPGFQTRTTNPRAQATTTSYQAFDQPTYDYPVRIDHPEGVVTEIRRDVFGKPLEIKRN